MADQDQRFGDHRFRDPGLGCSDGGGRDRIHRHQYAPPVPAAGRTVTRVWPDEPSVAAALEQPRDDLVLERPLPDGRFEQADGPFLQYERRLERSDGNLVETTRYRISVPWFNWLFALPIRALVGRRWHQPHHHGVPHANPWWAPPDRLSERQIRVLGLLAAASMSSAFINTLFTQTVKFAADDFGVDHSGVSDATSIVRAGIVLALPAAVMADRIGRKRVITFVAWAAPIVTALGAVAPTFPTLVATQAVGRPLGLALDFLVAVVAAEEMPRSSRAYAVSVLAMASGLGAGLAVIALPLADLGESSWRYIYVVTLVWLVVAVDIARRLPETTRFARPHTIAPPHRPPALRNARDRGHRGQLLRRPGERLPEQLPGGRSRFLRDADRVVHALDRDAGRYRLDHRRTGCRRPRPAAPARGRTSAGDHAHRCLVRRGRSTDVALGVRRRVHRRDGLPGAGGLPRRVVPDRQPWPRRRSADRGRAARRHRRVAARGPVARRRLAATAG